MDKNWLLILLALLLLGNNQLGINNNTTVLGTGNSRRKSNTKVKAEGVNPDNHNDNTRNAGERQTDEQQNSGIHRLIYTISDTHNRMRNLYDNFEAIATSLEKMLLATANMQSIFKDQRR